MVVDTPHLQIPKIRAPSAATVYGGNPFFNFFFRTLRHLLTLQLSNTTHKRNTSKFRTKKNLNFTMQQELEQWKEQISHLLNVANDYLREVPPNQLYAAAAIVVFTTLLLLSREWVRFVVEFVILLIEFWVFNWWILCFFLVVRFLKRTKSNTIVLTGLSGSGKTVIFYQVNLNSIGLVSELMNYCTCFSVFVFI